MTDNKQNNTKSKFAIEAFGWTFVFDRDEYFCVDHDGSPDHVTLPTKPRTKAGADQGLIRIHVSPNRGGKKKRRRALDENTMQLVPVPSGSEDWPGVVKLRVSDIEDFFRTLFEVIRDHVRVEELTEEDILRLDSLLVPEAQVYRDFLRDTVSLQDGRAVLGPDLESFLNRTEALCEGKVFQEPADGVAIVREIYDTTGIKSIMTFGYRLRDGITVDEATSFDDFECVRLMHFRDKDGREMWHLVHEIDREKLRDALRERLGPRFFRGLRSLLDALRADYDHAQLDALAS